MTATARAYLRISTATQDETSQRAQINAYALRHDITVDHWIVEQESGKAPWQERELNQVLAQSQTGDHILVSEISRIARSTIGVLGFLQAAAERGTIVHATTTNMVLDASIASQIIVTVLALTAQIERDLLRTRTKAALAARKAAGHKLGPPFGLKRKSILDPKTKEIERLIALDVPKRAIARMLNVSHNTLHMWLKHRPENTIETLPLPFTEKESTHAQSDRPTV